MHAFRLVKFRDKIQGHAQAVTAREKRWLYEASAPCHERER